MLCCLWDIDLFLECVILSAFQHLWGWNHLICLLDGGQYKAVSWEQHRSVVSCKNTRMQVFHYSTLHVKTWWTDLIWDINAGEIGQQPLENKRNVHHQRYNLRDQYFLTSWLFICSMDKQKINWLRPKWLSSQIRLRALTGCVPIKMFQSAGRCCCNGRRNGWEK